MVGNDYKTVLCVGGCRRQSLNLLAQRLEPSFSEWRNPGGDVGDGGRECKPVSWGRESGNGDSLIQLLSRSRWQRITRLCKSSSLALDVGDLICDSPRD